MTHPVPPTPTPPPGGPCYDDPAAYISPTAVEVRCDGTVVVAHEPVATVAYLREAARLMRQRATAATATQSWTTGPSWAGPGAVLTCEGHPIAVCGEGESAASDAEHIASWHPAVALAIADWLDEAADNLERLIPAWTAPPAGVDCPPGVAWRRPKLLAALIEGYYGRALAVARAYMGVAR